MQSNVTMSLELTNTSLRKIIVNGYMRQNHPKDIPLTCIHIIVHYTYIFEGLNEMILSISELLQKNDKQQQQKAIQMLSCLIHNISLVSTNKKTLFHELGT